MTNAARKELAKLNAKKEQLDAELAAHEKKEVVECYRSNSMDWYKQRNRLYEKIRGCVDSIESLTRRGYTTREANKVAEEAKNASYSPSVYGHFLVISYSRSLGSRMTKVAGWSDTLQAYVRFSKTSYNGFMNNVRGCAKLAGTTNISDIEFIDSDVYHMHIQQPVLSYDFSGQPKEIARNLPTGLDTMLPLATPSIIEQVISLASTGEVVGA